MVKSETRQDAEILVRNPSPRLFGKKFRDSKKSKNKPCKNETSRLIKNASEISRSCQHFPIPTFFEVPFTAPLFPFKFKSTKDEMNEYPKIFINQKIN